jgi:hypothetical protein
MLVERTFGWSPQHNYLIEHIFCDLDNGVHALVLENLDPNSSFDLENFTVNGVTVDKNLLKTTASRLEWNFMIGETAVVAAAPFQFVPNLTKIPAVVNERPRKVVQVKNYQPYIPLIQRSRQLNIKK